MDNKILVSVIVVTYNSSKTVLETLESIKSQTYERIELVVTDDHSKDDTVQVCQKWIDDNQTRFVRAKLITSDTNTGVACNANRGFANSHGEWIKCIAGDDMLLPNCIELFLEFAGKHPDCRIIEGKSKCFGSDKAFVANHQKFQDGLRKYYNRPLKTMYHDALRFVYLAGPPLIIKKDLIDDIGGFDVRYPCCEEFPFQIEAIKRTYLYYIDAYVVRYRVEQGSLSRNGSQDRCKNDIYKYFDEERGRLMLKEHMYFSWWDEKMRETMYRHNYPEIVNTILINTSVCYWWQRFKRWFHIK